MARCAPTSASTRWSTSLAEQTYLAAEEINRSDDETRRRFRHFIIPALAATNGTGGEHLSRTMQVEEAVGVALEALNDLADQLRRDRSE